MFSQRPLRVVEEVGVGSLARASHPSAKLVEVGEAEAVGVLDHDRVGGGDVEARLDDRGADKDIELAAHERRHRPGQLALLHLAVGDHDAGLWDQPPDAVGGLPDGADAVVDEERLALAVKLSHHHLADQVVGVGGHEGADRHPLLGRGGEDAEVPDSPQGHV